MGIRFPSFWLLIAVVVVTAIMVHPSFAAVFTVPLDVALLFGLRLAARREGRLEERMHAEIKRKGYV